MEKKIKEVAKKVEKRANQVECETGVASVNPEPGGSKVRTMTKFFIR